MKTYLTIFCAIVIVSGVLISTRFAHQTSHAQESGSSHSLVLKPTFADNSPSQNKSTRIPLPPIKSMQKDARQFVDQTKHSQGRDFSQPLPSPRPTKPTMTKRNMSSNPFAQNSSKSSGQQNPRSFGTTQQLPANQGFNVNRRTSNTHGLAKNARNVKSLVRAEYELPDEAANALVTFFALDKNEKIETKIIDDESSSMIQLQITTDEPTQRAIAAFLAAVYPANRLEAIREAIEGDNDAADEASESTDHDADQADDWDIEQFSFFMGISR